MTPPDSEEKRNDDAKDKWPVKEQAERGEKRDVHQRTAHRRRKSSAARGLFDHDTGALDEEIKRRQSISAARGNGDHEIMNQAGEEEDRDGRRDRAEAAMEGPVNHAECQVAKSAIPSRPEIRQRSS